MAWSGLTLPLRSARRLETGHRSLLQGHRDLALACRDAGVDVGLAHHQAVRLRLPSVEEHAVLQRRRQPARSAPARRHHHVRSPPGARRRTTSRARRGFLAAQPLRGSLELLAADLAQLVDLRGRRQLEVDLGAERRPWCRRRAWGTLVSAAGLGAAVAPAGLAAPLAAAAFTTRRARSAAARRATRPRSVLFTCPSTRVPVTLPIRSTNTLRCRRPSSHASPWLPTGQVRQGKPVDAYAPAACTHAKSPSRLALSVSA